MANNKTLTMTNGSTIKIGDKTLHMADGPVRGIIPYDPAVRTDGHGHAQGPDGEWYEMEPPKYNEGAVDEKREK